MKMIIVREGAFFKAKFVEGPRCDFFASENIGTPEEQPLVWPDEESVRLWMKFNGHEERKPFSFDVKAYLKTRHIKELMVMRKQCYRMPSGFNLFDKNYGAGVSLDEVLAEMNTRPHLPNKAEAKVLRQARAHQQRHR